MLNTSFGNSLNIPPESAFWGEKKKTKKEKAKKKNTVGGWVDK